MLPLHVCIPELPRGALHMLWLPGLAPGHRWPSAAHCPLPACPGTLWQWATPRLHTDLRGHSISAVSTLGNSSTLRS